MDAWVFLEAKHPNNQSGGATPLGMLGSFLKQNIQTSKAVATPLGMPGSFFEAKHPNIQSGVAPPHSKKPPIED
ncbi:MAG: hypothetical protein E6K70_16070 [Planctomycetota bacterium]|nr:MAG: hypothetical protein E6K70_16070 [Planctomycetota bacterium]